MASIEQIRQQQKRCKTLLAAVVFFMFFFVLGGSSIVHSEGASLTECITNGGYLVGTGDREFAYRDNTLFLPASTLKIVTSLLAFDLLGPDFRFETHLFLDAQQNLYIKGFGDPFLTSEEILRLCLSLHGLGITTVQNLFLDNSAYSIDCSSPGSLESSNPYDAPNGALAVNFNSLAIDKLSDGTIVSAEPQTPTLSIMELVPRDIPKGKQRININSIKTKTTLSVPEQYAGELFAAQLQKAGIKIEKGIRKQRVPKNLSPVLRYKNSKTLEEVMGQCLLYSNNFIANQVFLYCSTLGGTTPATWEKSRKIIKSYLTTHIGLSPEQFRVYDGAGLSRQNRITARGLVRVLKNFSPYKNLLTKKDGIFLKSGTLSGVYCYAGFLNIHGQSAPFAILLNQQKNTRDVLLKQLLHHYSSGT